MRRLLVLIPFMLWAGCDDTPDLGAPNAPPVECAAATRCAGNMVQACAGGAWVDDAICASGQECSDGQCVAVECVADCAGRACGDDGCQGSCGACVGAEICGVDGQCMVPAAACGDDVCNGDETCSTCAVDCGNCCGDGVCGADETCVSCASDCGCADPEVCDAQSAQCMGCVPQCTGRECGNDGCGGTCGACGDAACVDGLCPGACTPRCDGRACGDDGCEGVCGACDGDSICDAGGACVMPPAACGDGQCGAGEDCSTCAEDCGACCGDGQCAAGENCTSCAVDCACPDGERCADDRRACVIECVPQCNGRNCGDDGCDGDCGACDDAQACEAGVCVDVCQPDCTDRVCGGDGCTGRCGDCDAGSTCNAGVCDAICQPDCDGKVCGDDGCGGACGECDDGSECNAGACEAVCQPNCEGVDCALDGCGGVCGVCEGEEVCHPGGYCRVPLVIDAPGVYPREGPRDQGTLVLAERAIVTLTLAGADGECNPQALNRLTLRTAENAHVRAVRNSQVMPCAGFTVALTAGEYNVLVDFQGDDAYTLTAEFAPVPDTINASGMYERLPINGEDALTIQVAEPIVLSLVPHTPNLFACPFSATLELTQNGQLIGNGVSQRGGSGCGRVLVHLQPGEYQLQFYNDQPDTPIERFDLHVAMTPIGAAAADDDARIGRPGAAADAVDEIALTVAGPSIIRLRVEDGLGLCVPYRLGVDAPDLHNRARCIQMARQFPHPGGDLSLFIGAEAGLQPYVFILDIEPIPTADAVLPRSPILRPDVDGDHIFVNLAVPSRVDFALEGPGAPCDSGITRTQYDGYRTGPNGAERDGPCAWSLLLDPGVHGFRYNAEAEPRGVPMDRRVTITPIDSAIPGPGIYGRARSVEVESVPIVLDAPQLIRITAFRRNINRCFRYDFALIAADGRRVEPRETNCRELVALLPAGEHRFERQGIAADFHVEFIETFEGSGSSERPATDNFGDQLHLVGPPEAVLYLSQFVDGVCPQDNPRPLITTLDGVTRTLTCSLNGFASFNGHAQVSQAGRNPARTLAVRWDVARPLPLEVQQAADLPFHLATVTVDAAEMVLIEQTPCDDAPAVSAVRELEEDDAAPFVTPARCAAAFMATPGRYAIKDATPEGAKTWSVTHPGNALSVPEQRPMPRVGLDDTFAVPITADRTGRLHVRLTVNGGNCFLADGSWTIFSSSGARSQRVRQCEKVIDVPAEGTLGLLVHPPAGVTFSGAVSTWWE